MCRFEQAFYPLKSVKGSDHRLVYNATFRTHPVLMLTMQVKSFVSLNDKF